MALPLNVAKDNFGSFTLELGRLPLENKGMPLPVARALGPPGVDVASAAAGFHPAVAIACGAWAPLSAPIELHAPL